MADQNPFDILNEINATASVGAPFPLPQTEQAKYDAIMAESEANKQLAATQQVNIGKLDELAAMLGYGGRGLSFGLSERAVPALQAFGGYIGLTDQPKSYGELLQEQRQALDLTAARAPNTALGSEIGGAALGALLTGGLSAEAQLARAGAIGTAASRAPINALTTPMGRLALSEALVPQAVRETVFGIRGAAPTLSQLAKMGLAQGGIYGAATAAPETVEIGGYNVPGPVVGGVTGGIVGGVAAPVLGKALEFGGRKLFGSIAEAGGVGAERGAIGLGKGPAYTAAEIEAARNLQSMSAAELAGAQARAAEAAAQNLPLYLPEAAQVPSMYQSAKMLASKPEAVNVARRAIEARSEDAVNRITNKLDVISSERAPFQGLSRLVEASKSLLETKYGERSGAVGNLYSTAFNSGIQVEDETVNKILKSGVGRRALKETLDRPDFMGRDPRDLEVIHQIKRSIQSKAEAARRAGDNELARAYGESATTIVNKLGELSPEYKQANSLYEKMSKGINAVEQSKIGALSQIDLNNPQSLNDIFRLEPEVISSLRQDFKEAGKLADWEAAVRSHLQKIVDQTKNLGREEQAPIAKLVGSPAQRKQLKAALGKKFEQIIKPLEIESTILEGQKIYQPRSDTFQLTQKAAETEAALPLIGRLLTEPVATAKGFLASALAPAERQPAFYESLAQLYFGQNPQTTLFRISPLIEGLRKAEQQAVTTGRVGAQVGAKETPVLSGQKGQSKVSSKSQLGAGLGGAVGISEIDSLLADINATSPISVQSAKQPEANTVEPMQVSALIKNQPPLIRAIIDVESKGKPAAKSGKGATGLMQLLPSTAAALGVDPKDPAQNIEGGTKYLAQMKEQFKNDKLALAAYNWGPGNLQKAINKTQKAGLKATWENILRTTFVPKETRQYVNKVLTLKNKYSV
jgi:hypothetical protein